MKITVFFGMFIISVGLILNIINSIEHNDYKGNFRRIRHHGPGFLLGMHWTGPILPGYGKISDQFRLSASDPVYAPIGHIFERAII